ncbi:hypothetical protein ACFPRL_30840 [Pseudoclavibacter helvolus]
MATMDDDHPPRSAPSAFLSAVVVSAPLSVSAARAQHAARPGTRCGGEIA